VQDPRGLTTTYTYNGLGDLLSQASPDTGTTTFTHDAAGNVATQTDARGIPTTYAYDGLNRAVSAAVADGTVTWEYDNVATGGPGARGRLTKVTDPSGSTSWAYDLQGRVTSKVQTVGTAPAARTFTTLYGYTAGLLTSITYPSGRVVTLGHDLQGQATSLAVDASPVLAGGQYFPFGGVRQWTWANGQPYQRLFDGDGRISGVTLGPSTHTWADLNQGFGYDVLNRLTSAGIAAGQALGFSYDANGNRTGTTVNGGSATTYTYPGSSHRLSSLSGATTRSFAYDAAGNLTASAGVAYVYDGRGRLKQAGSATYLVNGLGQRVKKTAGAETYFAYDEAGRLIGEYDGSGTPIQEYAWLGDIPVAVVRPASPGGFTVYYVWADHLGTPRVVSDAANVVRWEWANAHPFGAHAANDNPSGAGSFAFNLRFPGQYFDAETGTHYNYFRDYDPAIGRYVQSDPIGLKGGLNTFGYVSSGPLTRTDPRGLLVISGKCSADKRKKLEDAERDVRKKLDGSCGGCNEGKGGCVPCEYFKQLQNLLDTTPVECPDSTIAPDTAPPIVACGWQQDIRIGITPIGFRPNGPEGYCGCLASIVYHELLHLAVGGNDKHDDIYRFERDCYKCGVGATLGGGGSK